MDYEEQKRLAELKAELQKERTLELQRLRAGSSQDRERARTEAKQELTEIQQKQLLELELIKHKLQPEKLDNEFFDHERRRRVDHFYDEQQKDAELDRQKEVMSHELECSLIKEKFLLKLRQKYGDKNLSEDDMKLLMDQLNKPLDES